MCTDEELMKSKRLRMVERIEREMKIADRRVLDAMNQVPRHLFVDEAQRANAYELTSLKIRDGVTISYPEIIAYMIEKLGLRPNDKVLDVGGGTGYHAAVVSRIVREVVSVEIVSEMVIQAKENLKRCGYQNVRMMEADGANGYLPEAPFDAINVVCTAPSIPIQLVNQLRVGGRMIIPIGPTAKPTGKNAQKLVLVEKTAEPFEREGIQYDSFYNSYDLRWIHVVPMIRKEADLRIHP